MDLCRHFYTGDRASPDSNYSTVPRCIRRTSSESLVGRYHSDTDPEDVAYLDIEPFDSPRSLSSGEAAVRDGGPPDCRDEQDKEDIEVYVGEEGMLEMCDKSHLSFDGYQARFSGVSNDLPIASAPHHRVGGYVSNPDVGEYVKEQIRYTKSKQMEFPLRQSQETDTSTSRISEESSSFRTKWGTRRRLLKSVDSRSRYDSAGSSGHSRSGTSLEYPDPPQNRVPDLTGHMVFPGAVASSDDRDDSGYAESSLGTGTRVTKDSTPRDSDSGFRKAKECAADTESLYSEHTQSVVSQTSSASSRPQSARMLSRRQFQQSAVIRYRYPSKFHDSSSGQQQKQRRANVPASLCPPSRYAKEPKLQTDKGRRKGERRWPQPPLYPPKARHVGTECEIIKMVDKMEIGVQATPKISSVLCQCAPPMSDSSTQYPRKKVRHVGVQLSRECKDQGTQNVRPTKNKMVETSVRVLYFPEVNTQHSSTQCQKVQTVDMSTQCELKPSLCHTECQTTPEDNG